jgi:hypothetical protein
MRKTIQNLPMANAQQFTSRAGGTWVGAYGKLKCPCCETPDALTIRDGDSKPLVHCATGCNRRAIISVAKVRGWLS